MSNEMIAGLSTLITAIVSAVAGAVVLVMNARASSKAREAAGRQNEYEKIIARYERDIQRREAHESNQDDLIAKLREVNASIRERFADVRGRFQMVYQYARRQADFMRARGLSPEAPPELPEAVAGAFADDVTFDVRQVEQESKVIKAVRPGPPGGNATQTDDSLSGAQRRTGPPVEPPPANAPEGQ